MKKSIAICLLLMFVFMISCQQSITYQDVEQCVVVVQSDHPAFQLTQDEESVILNVLNTKTWESDVTKTAYDYEIVVLDTAGNRIALRYATVGVINDWTNEQHLKLSQEENDQIKTILAQYITVND
jgi:competence protein ComGC